MPMLSRRIRARDSSFIPLTGKDSVSTRPMSGFSNPDMRASKLVLPAPEGPVRAIFSPLATDKIEFVQYANNAEK